MYFVIEALNSVNAHITSITHFMVLCICTHVRYTLFFSLLLRFVNDTFDPEQSATIGNYTDEPYVFNNLLSYRC